MSSSRWSVRANPDAVASGVRRSWHASETSWANVEEATVLRAASVRIIHMTDLRHVFEDDLQAATPEVRLGLSRAGVRGVAKAIRVRYGQNEKLIAAEIDCTVDLHGAQKGVHMSRFPELFEEAIERVVLEEAFLVEDLAAHIAEHIVGRQGAGRAETRIVARYPIERRTPVTDLATQELVALIGVAAASERGVRRAVGVEATGINACPCAQGLVRNAASARLLEAGFEEGDVDRILELVPLATHNQRGRGTLYVGSESRVNAERLVEIVEASMSSPVYELLKRPDELFVVEHAHLQPRFVEDSVRLALHGTLDAYPELAEGDFLLSRQVNLETIHTHDVVAERYGTVGELRRELAGDSGPSRHTDLGDWLAA
jgi:GTP cyclohydrolase-4